MEIGAQEEELLMGEEEEFGISIWSLTPGRTCRWGI